jgi:hypothetical protein
MSKLEEPLGKHDGATRLRVTKPPISEAFALFKCDHFVDIQMWPLTARLNPRLWLSNFSDGELPFALNLLNSFIYFNQPMMDQLLLAAFQDLSKVEAIFGHCINYMCTWRKSKCDR